MNAPILTCHDAILDSNWNDPEFEDELEIIKQKLRTFIDPKSMELLE